MKKIKTQLSLTKTTVRVLSAAELSAVQGGGARVSTADPAACLVGADLPGGGKR
jgi:hypothetical protein